MDVLTQESESFHSIHAQEIIPLYTLTDLHFLSIIPKWSWKKVQEETSSF